MAGCNYFWKQRLSELCPRICAGWSFLDVCKFFDSVHLAWYTYKVRDNQIMALQGPITFFGLGVIFGAVMVLEVFVGTRSRERMFAQ